MDKFTYESNNIEDGVALETPSQTNTTKTTNNTKSWFMRIMSVLLTDKALRMRGGGGKRADSGSSGSGYYEIV